MKQQKVFQEILNDEPIPIMAACEICDYLEIERRHNRRAICDVLETELQAIEKKG